MEFNFQTKISSAYQNITNIKSNSLVSGNTAHVDPEIELNLEELNMRENITRTWDRDKAIKTLIADIEEEPHRILMATYKSETAREISVLTDAIIWILSIHF